MEDRYVKERERAHIPDPYKWDLTDICPSDEAWAEAKRKLTADLAGISAFCGQLAESPEQLQRCLHLLDSLRKECMRLACYASMKSDLDTRDAKYLAMDQEMGQLGSDLASLSSYIEPEILKIGADNIDRFIKQEPKLAIYRHIFDDILRKKDHTGTEGEERIIAALRAVWPNAPRQRCQEHFLGNLADEVLANDTELRKQMRVDLGGLPKISDFPEDTPLF